VLFCSIYWKEFLDGLLLEKQMRKFPWDLRIYSIMCHGDGVDEGEAKEIYEQALKDILNIPPSIIPQVIWELCENNFAEDMLWLDTLLRRCHDSTNVYSLLWSEEVYKLCGKQEVNTPIPMVNILTIFVNTRSQMNCMINQVRSSFVSERWMLWVKHVEAFRQLMSTWPKFPDHLRTPVPTENECLFEETELNIFTFYAQTHFNYIGCLPVVPCCIPDFSPLWMYNVYCKSP